MTERRGFVLRVKPEQVDRYVAAHREVWPEMLEEVSARWQDALPDLLVDRVPVGGPAPLAEIFRLD